MRSSQGTWAVLVVALAAAGPAAAAEIVLRPVADEGWCDDDHGDPGRERHCEVREAVWPGGGHIEVDGRPNGGIEVTGWDRKEVRLRAKVVATADTTAEARELAAEVRIDTSGAIRAAGPERRSKVQWWVSYRLEVPRTSQLALQSVNGGISLRDLSGAVEATTVNGGLHFSRLGGTVHARTTNGGVHIELAGHEWQGEGLDARTTNGGLHVTIPADYNARLEVATAHGGFHVPADMRSDRASRRIETVLGRGGRLIRLETTHGGVHLDRS